MNLKWVIIGTIFIVLLVAFGRNPVQEAREQRRKEIDEKGMLVYQIEKHLEENKPAFGSSGRMMNPGGMYGAGATGAAGMQRPLGSGYQPGSATTMQPALAAPVVPPQGVTRQPQSYYPPPPLPENNTASGDIVAP